MAKTTVYLDEKAEKELQILSFFFTWNGDKSNRSEVINHALHELARLTVSMCENESTAGESVIDSLRRLVEES